MICWMTKINEEAGVEGMSFDDFMQQAAFFYSQRSKEEGLKYIFQLFDRDKKGYLTRAEFLETYQNIGTDLSAEHLMELFNFATKNRDRLDFHEFSQIMIQ